MLHLVTIATHSQGYLPILEKQIKDKNLSLVKLGEGKKYIGHFMKDLEMISYLKTDKVKDDDIIVFVDGFDTLLLSDIDEIIDKFKSFDCKLLLSVENVGGLQFIHSAVFQKVNGKFINTGIYMGYAKFLREFLEDMYSKDFDKKSNQKTWANYLDNNNKNKFIDIKLDIDSEIFLNYSFTTTNHIKYRNKRVVIKKEKKEFFPCFIQGNGGEDLSKVIKLTGYQDYDIHKDNRTFKVIENNLKAIFYIYPIAALYIALLTLVIIIVITFIIKIYQMSKDKFFYIYI
jgi:hypothetical protein